MVQEAQDLNPDVTVECYLDAKYYHYDPVQLNGIVDFNTNFANLERRHGRVQHVHLRS